MLNSKELRDMDEAKLVEKLSQTQEELFKLRFQHATAQLERPIVWTCCKRTSPASRR